MPKFTRRPTDRSDDDLRRLWKDAKPGIVTVEAFNDWLKATFGKPRVQRQTRDTQERILGLGAEDAAANGLIDMPI